MLRFLGMLFTLGSLGVVLFFGAIAAIVAIYGNDLPDHEALARYEPDVISRVYAGDGTLMAEYFNERRVFAPIDEVPELVKNAFISAEDRSFYEHAGFDALGILSAVVDYARGQRLRGASTITQQVMKNFLLTNERSFERKIREIILATRIEQVMSKDRILELYLNEIYLGARSYGIVAAAANYFGKPLEYLSPAEAAYLAALPKAPSTLHPVDDREDAIARRNYVLDQMARNGHLTEDEAAAAAAEPLLTVLDGSVEPVLARAEPRGWFAEEVRRRLTDRFGADAVLGGGLAVRATVDPQLQEIATRALRDRLEEWDRVVEGWRGAQARLPEEALGSEDAWRTALGEVALPRDIAGWRLAVVLEVGSNAARIGIEGVPEDADGHFIPMRDIEWQTRRDADDEVVARIRAPADVFDVGDVVHVKEIRTEDGGFDRWSLRQVPALDGGFMAMDPQTGRVLALVGGFSFDRSSFNRATQARRQPGSAFKPFVYAAALDTGLTPSTIILDAPITVDDGVNPPWRPKNAGGDFLGPMPMRTGIERSRNLMTIRLAQEIGMDKVAEYAERFGVYEDMPQYLPMTLGAGETTLWQMTTAYAMFANGGLRVEPAVMDRVQDRRGETIWKHDARVCLGCEAPWSPGAAEPWARPDARRIMDAVTAWQLTSMMRGVTTRGTAAGLSALGFPTAGKTGTTNESRDVWFMGYTPNMVAGCFIGHDQPRTIGRGASGGRLCAPVFQAFMAEAMETREPGAFIPPPDAVLVRVDRFSGVRLPDDASGPNVVVEAFRPQDAPRVGEWSGRRIGDGGVISAAASSGPPLGEEGAEDGEADDPSAQGDRDRPRPSRQGGVSTSDLY